MKNTTLREREIFLAALDYDHPDARLAFVNQVCGDDMSLRDRILALLKADAVSDGFLQLPLDVSTTEIPSQVGPFTLGELVGKGGMGVVYRAWDDQLSRYVAVKLLQGVTATDPAAATRFRHEARVTARLQHPGVPPIHEVGELPDYRPYLAMKLVEGRTLAELLRARQDLTADIGRFIAVFEQVCQTLAYAHTQGVIHRDLKPANIMVGAFGEVQVMDWGLAKVLMDGNIFPAKPLEVPPGVTLPSSNETLAFWSDSNPTPVADASEGTRAGAVLGTPGYMAPEQARGEATDSRSDVFGLGAVLCEILTGSSPFTGPSTADILQDNAVGDTSPIRKRLANSGADLELVTLCEVCLAANPADRPRNAGAVAEAVAAWRGNAAERIRQAELDSAAAASRIREEQKRRRVAQWAALLIAAVLLLGVAGTSWGLLKERDARQQAITQRDQATEARDRAMNAFDTVTSSVAETSLYSQTSLSPQQKAFLSQVLGEYRELAAEQGNDPHSRQRVAKAQLRVGQIEHRLGRSLEAEAAYRQAAADQSQDRLTAALALGNLAALLTEIGRPAEAEPETRAAVAIWDKLLDESPDNAEYRLGRAKLHLVSGNMYNYLRRSKESEAAFRSADADLSRLIADEGKPAYRAMRGLNSANLANFLLFRTDQLDEALSTARAAEELLEPLGTAPTAEIEHRIWLAYARLILSKALVRLGRSADAEATLRSAIAVREQLVADFPGVPEYRLSLCRTLSDLGKTLAFGGKLADAEAPFRAALAAAERLTSDEPSNMKYQVELITSRQNVGQVLIDLGRANAAEPVLRAAAVASEQLAVGKLDPSLLSDAAGARGTLASCLESLHRLADAELENRAAVALAERATLAAPADRDAAILLAAIRGNHGSVLLKMGRTSDALAAFTRSAEDLGPVFAKTPSDPAVKLYLRNAHGRRAEALNKLERHTEALAELDRAIELSVPSEQPEFRAARAVAFIRIGQTAKALAETTELAADPACTPDVLFELCRVYALAAKADPSRANDYGARAVELLSRAKTNSKKDVDLSCLASDQDLVGLLGREDFRRLIGQTELAPPPRLSKPASVR